jgi:hypothetical protein
MNLHCYINLYTNGYPNEEDEIRTYVNKVNFPEVPPPGTHIGFGDELMLQVTNLVFNTKDRKYAAFLRMNMPDKLTVEEPRLLAAGFVLFETIPARRRYATIELTHHEDGTVTAEWIGEETLEVLISEELTKEPDWQKDLPWTLVQVGTHTPGVLVFRRLDSLPQTEVVEAPDPEGVAHAVSNWAVETE